VIFARPALEKLQESLKNSAPKRREAEAAPPTRRKRSTEEVA